MASLAVCASRSTKYTFGPWVWHQGQCGGHMLMSGDIDLPYSLLLHIPSIETGGNEDKFWVGLDRKWSKWRQIWGLLVCLNRKWSKWRQIWGLVESRPMISCSSDIAPGPGDSANVVVSPSWALYVWLCIWGAFYMCGTLYRCVWYVVGLYGQACQQCGPLANHRLAHQDWSHGPHICNILRPYHLGHMPHVIMYKVFDCLGATLCCWLAPTLVFMNPMFAITVSIVNLL